MMVPDRSCLLHERMAQFGGLLHPATVHSLLFRAAFFMLRCTRKSDSL
jgi:hypothetical protein